MPSATPLLSVILVTPDDYATVRTTVRHLARQTVCDRLELILVAPSDDIGLVVSDVEGLHGWQVIATGPIRSSSEARVAGVRRSKAPVIAFGEDHAFPGPLWAEALLLAHEGPWAAVGPVVHNANPNTLISWADLLIGYGPWLEPHPGGIVDFLPGHNSSYKRDLLLAYGPALEDMLDAETVMHWDLRANGERLYLEPAARLAHMNYAMPGVWTRAQFHNGRLFAAQRVQCAPHWKRLFLLAASPLIPFVRLVRTLRATTRLQRWGLMVRVTPVLFFGLLIDGLGQLVGYATGAGSAMQHLVDIEFHRVRYARLERVDLP